MLQAVNPPGEAFPGLSQAVVIHHGAPLFTSGHVSTDHEGNFVDGDFPTQVANAFAALGRTLAAAGIGFDGVVQLTYYVVDYQPACVETIKAVRGPLLARECPPASVLIPVSQLFDRRAKIEIAAVAAVPPAVVQA